MNENLTITLPNGQVKNQSEVKVFDVMNALPMFMHIAVGYENGWYVQTSDTHPETYLSCAIAKELETKEQAMEIAKNVSFFTGMEIVEW